MVPPAGFRGAASEFAGHSDARGTALATGPAPSGHAFTSLLPQLNLPVAVSAVGGGRPLPASANSLEARKLMHERDRLSSLGNPAAAVAAFVASSSSSAASLPSQLLHAGANADAVLRDRILTEQRDRMMLAAAAAAAEYGGVGVRQARAAERPELFAAAVSRTDNLLGSSALAAQSALLRPTLGCPPGMPAMKLPQPYAPFVDPTLNALNLPF